jgi:hypothetical protein
VRVHWGRVTLLALALVAALALFGGGLLRVFLGLGMRALLLTALLGLLLGGAKRAKRALMRREQPPRRR